MAGALEVLGLRATTEEKMVRFFTGCKSSRTVSTYFSKSRKKVVEIKDGGLERVMNKLKTG